MILGIDESGRGPVLGDMIVAGVVLSSWNHQELLKSRGVRDSKTLTRRQREKLFPFIQHLAKRVVTRRISARRIDKWRKLGRSLNELEARVFAEVISEANPTGVVVDCADVKPDRFLSRMRRYSRLPSDVICEHRADQNYPIVSAASVVAKVLRDRSIDRLSSKYGRIGSGYCSDAKTVEFLIDWFSKKGEFPHFARTTWSTCVRIARENGAPTLPNSSASSSRREMNAHRMVG